MHLALQGYGCEHLFVLDRCTDGSEQYCVENHIPHITNTQGEGRQCSRSRNLGAAFFPNDDILFLDADKLPNFNVLELDKAVYDVTLVKCETDIRDHLGVADGVPTRLWGTYHNGLFSSCVFIRRKMIDAVICKYGHLFDVDFVEWGEEDRHLGDLLYSVGATCGFADRTWRVAGRTSDCKEKMVEFMNMSRLRIGKLFALGLEHLIREGGNLPPIQPPHNNV